MQMAGGEAQGVERTEQRQDEPTDRGQQHLAVTGPCVVFGPCAVAASCAVAHHDLPGCSRPRTSQGPEVRTSRAFGTPPMAEMFFDRRFCEIGRAPGGERVS